MVAARFLQGGEGSACLGTAALGPGRAQCSRLLLFIRLFMPNLVPPKIPDGERVDFDVSGGFRESRPPREGPHDFGAGGRSWAMGRTASPASRVQGPSCPSL